ncbi:MAG: hypothetical protein H0U94_00655 [Acidobacteria bacterium]|nr:hypothetical protein [Acidobacteriota bacterium]
MPTDTFRSLPQSPGPRFILRAAAWSLGLFGLLRLAWFETHAVLPLTEWQARVALISFGAPALSVEITTACSGADVLSLCTGAILAYPANWRTRLTGAAGGITLVLALNTLRIGTLGRAAASPSFDFLHVYAWPGLLTLTVAAYVFTWMRQADRHTPIDLPASPSAAAADSAGRSMPSPGIGAAGRLLGRASGRFAAWTAALLVLFTAVSPVYLESAAVLSLAAVIARAAAAVLGVLGVHATATANMLSTERGAFLVTQECVATPLIPVYVAAVLAYVPSWRRGALALLAAGPLFAGLGIARLLVVALPATLVGSPDFLIHAFSQVLFAAIVVCVAARWRHGPGVTAARRALLGAAAGGVFVYLLGVPYTQAITSPFAQGSPLDDPQGAVLLLPAFQVGLYLALVIAGFAVLNWRSCVTGLATLGLSQVVFFGALHLLARHADFTAHARDVRAWAIAGPLLVVAAMVTHERPGR